MFHLPLSKSTLACEYRPVDVRQDSVNDRGRVRNPVHGTPRAGYTRGFANEGPKVVGTLRRADGLRFRMALQGHVMAERAGCFCVFVTTERDDYYGDRFNHSLGGKYDITRNH
jgi:hypothetical protein